MRKSGSLLIPLSIIVLYYGFWVSVMIFLLSRYPMLREIFPIGGVDYLASMNVDTFEPVYSSVKDTVLARNAPLRLLAASIGAIVLTIPVSWVYFITSRARRIDQSFLQTIMILPVVVGIVGSVGSGTRWYRTLFLEEIHRDYVRSARAKGLSEHWVLFRHVLRNALIPILTGVVVVLPLLFIGSLLTESFFGIPGLGSYTIDAINRQDFAIVRAMVFLGSVLYILGLLLTDISYTLVDPRIRLS